MLELQIGDISLPISVTVYELSNDVIVIHRRIRLFVYMQKKFSLLWPIELRKYVLTRLRAEKALSLEAFVASKVSTSFTSFST